MNKPRLITLVGMIFAAAVIRLLPHPWNFTPVAALALFGGAQFSDKRLAFLVPLSAVFLSDIILGFYPLWWVVYVAHALVVLMGISIQNRKSFFPIAGATVASSLVFFFISNLSYFYSSGLFPMSISGLMQCYTLALPFFRNSIVGDAFFSSLLFGSFTLAETRFPVLRASPARAN